MTSHELNKSPAPLRSKAMPKINDAAWHGPIGDAVRRLAPGTEADPVAVLVSVLALFGALVGEKPHVRVGGVRHPARVWPLLVGRTAAGRKGTSYFEARKFVTSCSSSAGRFMGSRVVSGLSTGEGLIAALVPEEDAKAPDGKLVVMEPEFARILSAAKREGNTLSPVLRALWDDGSASILTKNSPMSCSDAHLVLIAHVTPRELRAKLGESEITGGTVNRLLPVLTERAQLLPHEIELEEPTDVHRLLADAEDTAKKTGQVRRTRDADTLWTSAYMAMNDDEPDGMLGACLARGPAYTMRLALLYALADSSDRIGVDHLRAGLAVWQYAADSARLLFGDLSGTSDLNRLCDFLARSPGGRTRTEITRECFGGNVKKDIIDALLDALMASGDVKDEEVRPPRGRPTTRYFWTGTARDMLGALLAGEPMDVVNE
jgi:hypothetical protein